VREWRSGNSKPYNERTALKLCVVPEAPSKVIMVVSAAKADAINSAAAAMAHVRMAEEVFVVEG
jgi:hypothetical protein